MASTEGGYGGQRRKSGRKRKALGYRKKYLSDWNKTHKKRIYLEQRIFQAWLQANFDAGYEACSDSDFAAHLLSLEYRKR